MKRLLKIYFSFLSSFSPRLAARQAFELFQVPLNKKIRKKELAFYSEHTPTPLDHPLESIACYEWGAKNGHLIILVHGWESNAASLSYIANKLAASGYKVVSFNLPAHGYSKLKKSNIKICIDVLHAVIKHYDCRKPISFVTHSFGSLVTSYALSRINIKVDQFVMLTAPNNASEVFKFYQNTIGINGRTFDILVEKANGILGEPLSNVSVERFGKKIDYNQLTIIQDPKDRIVSVADAEAIVLQWDNSRLLLVENTGHYKMLWNDEVSNMVLDQF